MGQESKLKKLLTSKKEEALKLQLNAFMEGVEITYIAKCYLDAIEEIDKVCKDRNRY